MLLLAFTKCAAVAMAAAQEECLPGNKANKLADKCPPIDADMVIKMQALSSAWAGANGLQVLRPTGIEIAPVSIRPMPFPRSAYDHVKGLMVDFNTPQMATMRSPIAKTSAVLGRRIQMRKMSVMDM